MGARLARDESDSVFQNRVACIASKLCSHSFATGSPERVDTQSSINTFARMIFGPFIFLMMIRRPSTSSTSSSSGTRLRVS